MISLLDRITLIMCPDYAEALLALQGASTAVRSTCAMRTLVLLIATLLASASLIRGASMAESPKLNSEATGPDPVLVAGI